LPLYVNEFLAWHFWSYVFLASVFLIVSLILIGLSTLLFRLNEETVKKYDHMSPILAVVLLIVAAPIFGHGVIQNVYYATKIKIAPRVYIMDTILEKTK
jgi:succinate dehydrogenase/fumarate reductase cytochrome b subunit